MADHAEPESHAEAKQADRISKVTTVALENISILEEQLRYLRMHNAITAEVEVALHSLTRSTRTAASSQSQSPLKAASSVLRMLPFPVEYKTTYSAGYLGPNLRHITVPPGRRALVFGFTPSRDMALAWGFICGRVGWIPADVLRLVYGQQQYGSEIWTALSTYDVRTQGFITWKAGENISICKWDMKGNCPMNDWAGQSGAGINLATGDFGRFDIRGLGLEKVDMMAMDCTAYLQGLKVYKEFGSGSSESEEAERKGKESFSQSQESSL
ncbi:hypothetical protein LTR99_009623 [Exophiala xenobiotica]|uniref:Uncharacterized protein n=1 Tax=Vermiconidia calcicola TaxID=1690605 RepID=A0AAV9PWD2_9PEZI|nr:hypothetical protein LTR96_001723 [Exophiala xenobiotica]KAK5530461.1 hypothetical protein LTR25_009039 [Vermiconidia calcicola]KAK5539098.1 hypothetical protein LTR23_006912 [Chaetothyriales sp. CCFEE 6169]KAK5294225.1 hypothetical protein LTR99_009623 [Exophiala xenobiotica]KAK5336118.1 hypothetical protein LTR98_007448 [Exophiala xenobiotica]